MPTARFPLQDAKRRDGGAASPLLTIALGQRLAAAVANDSGAGHLLAASGCPIVSLFDLPMASLPLRCGGRPAKKSNPCLRQQRSHVAYAQAGCIVFNFDGSCLLVEANPPYAVHFSNLIESTYCALA